MQLNKQVYETLKQEPVPSYPEKILQFGEGNFLRGFTGWMVQKMNKQGIFQGQIVAIQPTPHGKVVPKLNAQEGLYTFVQKGMDQGETVDQAEVITAISRGINPYEAWQSVLDVAASPDICVIFSNTTEAGLVYEKEDMEPGKAPLSFPGKLTLALEHRFQQGLSGVFIIPCELVEGNGDLLKEIVLKKAEDWELSAGFVEWLLVQNTFCNTLVDRIVPGFPKGQEEAYEKRLGYQDDLIVIGEPYHLFAIDDDEKRLEDVLPLKAAGINVHYGDVQPYRDMKVALLNAPHTSMFALAYLAGIDTVGEVMNDSLLRSFTEEAMSKELIPVFKAEATEKEAFAVAVLERFENPFTKHNLTDLGMNATQKWRTRVLPLFHAYVSKYDAIPPLLSLSLAGLIAYEKPIAREGAFLKGQRGSDTYQIRDSDAAIDLFEEQWGLYDQGELTIRELVQAILAAKELWGMSLADVEGLSETVTAGLEDIRRLKVRGAIEKRLKS
ncbi:tagaturonate reductase [Bacillaceae bacterium SIJ1]|uniref:tagaturonate reductase n=1 Tax=Litoribacterium kuwaitense TaxID=1398745 RepID=UPI0013E9F600|nr:tagaturonate reductase [Litoribacterium kuwaitense]NGP45266.1 tagaturonate reductase [Litoribacterium kuwaitense]